MKDTKKRYTGDEIKKARQSSSMGLIIRGKEPTNLETPFDQVDSFLTPTELFYIRSHFPAPKLDLASYQLRVDGAVRNPFSLSYKEFRDMPSETRIATLECAGNSRVFLVPQVEGAQWELVSNDSSKGSNNEAPRLPWRAMVLTMLRLWPRRMSVLLWEPETDVAIQSAGLTLIGTPSGVTRSAR